MQVVNIQKNKNNKKKSNFGKKVQYLIIFANQN